MPLTTARISTFLCLTALMLAGCVGGTLGNHQDIEMFPLRSASDSEGQKLKRCLKNARALQEHHKKKTGKYVRKLQELPIDDYCNGLLLTQTGTATGYEIRAELREDDTTVRWSINEEGVVEEHLDPEAEPDLEF